MTTTVLPLSVLYCLALPLVSRIFPPSFDVDPGGMPPGMRMTWLERNSSDTARSEYGAVVSRSRPCSSDSVVGTKRIWWSTGRHCEGRVLLKKARRKGFRGCIQSVVGGGSWQDGLTVCKCAHGRARLSCSSDSVGAQSHGLESTPELFLSVVSGPCNCREPRLICLRA